MIHKGRRFNECKLVVTLPNFDEAGNRLPHVPAGNENHVYFGRTFADKRITPKAIKTNYVWDKDAEVKEPVYAEPIANKGHSLTNMMYGADGFMYLAKDGKVWRSKLTKVAA